VLSTLDSQVIVGVKSHEEAMHDCKILGDALAVHRVRQIAIELVVVEYGYLNAKKHLEVDACYQTHR